MAASDEKDLYDPISGRPALILGGHDFHSITEAVAAPVEGKTPTFKRTIAVQSKEAPSGLWYRAAAGRKVEEKNGEFVVDNGLKLRIEGARIRGSELLVPVELKDGSRMIVVTYSW